MERKQFPKAPCSIARTLDVIGDWWTPLIIRECLYGIHRFDEFQWWLGIGRNILTRRLVLLVEHGVLERRLYQEKPKRYEYHLTDKGYDAATMLLAMMPFGEKWYFKNKEEPIWLYSHKTGRRIKPILIDEETGESVDPREIYAGPGPGFRFPEHIQRKRFAKFFEAKDKKPRKTTKSS